MVQVNTISATCRTAFGIPPWATGAALAFFATLILLGGMTRLMRITEKIAPFMAIFFLLGGRQGRSVSGDAGKVGTKGNELPRRVLVRRRGPLPPLRGTLPI